MSLTGSPDLPEHLYNNTKYNIHIQADSCKQHLQSYKALKTIMRIVNYITGEYDKSNY